MSLLIKGARLIEPRDSIDQVLDVMIDAGKIKKIGKDLSFDGETIEAKGLCLVPGFIDFHVHFRDPGEEYKEDIRSGIMAALRGGFVGCVSMPNTDPPCDNQTVVAHILQRAREFHYNIFPCGTISKGRLGKDLSEMGELVEAGCVAVSDDGDYVQDSLLMRHAMEYASMFKLIVISHSIDGHLSRKGLINEGSMSTLLGLKASPSCAEEIAVSRDITLAKFTGARLHIAHLSTKEALDLVRQAKADGVNVSCEVTPHHLALTEEELVNYDTHYKMNPPLRTLADTKALIDGLADGTIDCIATDHAPHSEEEKEREMDCAPFGVTGLETAFGVVMTTVLASGKMGFLDVIDRMAIRPAQLLGLSHFNHIAENSKANFTLCNPDEEWTVTREHFLSKSGNSSFIGRKLKGRIHYTVCNGKVYKFV